MIKLDYTFVVQVVLFLALLFLLRRLLFTPFIALLEEREKKTEGVRSEATALTAEGERLQADYESAVAKARDQGAALKEGILQEARSGRERILTQAREQAAGKLAAVREEVRQEMVKARQFAAREAEEIARQMAEKVLGRKIG
jgi:F-type H+-transporting ATPase subunit b